MTSSNVNNPSTSLIDSLKNPILHTVSVAMSLPTGIPSGSTTPMPTGTTPTPTKTITVSSSSLPTSLTGANFTDENMNWTEAWAKEMEDSNFTSWMEANLTYYATNAPTYFSNLATEYDTLTNTTTSVKVTPVSIPNESGFVANNTDSIPTTSLTPKTYDITGYLPFTS